MNKHYYDTFVIVKSATMNRDQVIKKELEIILNHEDIDITSSSRYANSIVNSIPKEKLEDPRELKQELTKVIRALTRLADQQA